MQQFMVTGYHADADIITAIVRADDVSASMLIRRKDFEHWLSSGTNTVAYFLSELNRENDVSGRKGYMPVSAFWDEPAIVITADLYSYLTRSQSSIKEVMAEISLERALNEIAAVIPISAGERALIQGKMSQYGFNRVMATVEKITELRKQYKVTPSL